MIREAPFTLAPMIAARPTGPAPKITTSDATSTGAFVMVIPRPQPATQVSIEISAADTPWLKRGVAYSSLTIISSDIAPVREKTGVPSAMLHVAVALAPPPFLHLSDRMFKQLKHRPHEACRLTMTR